MRKCQTLVYIFPCLGLIALNQGHTRKRNKNQRLIIRVAYLLL